jgi:hypothetical protein
MEVGTDEVFSIWNGKSKLEKLEMSLSGTAEEPEICISVSGQAFHLSLDDRRVLMAVLDVLAGQAARRWLERPWEGGK